MDLQRSSGKYLRYREEPLHVLHQVRDGGHVWHWIEVWAREYRISRDIVACIEPRQSQND